MSRPKARSTLVRSHGTAQSHLELLRALRPIACEEADPGRLLARAARLLAVSFGAYCVLDVVELEPRRVEIAHADLSHVERLREAARTAQPLAVQRLVDLAVSGEPKLVNSKRALAALDFGFVTAGACLVLPIVVGGELHAVLTIVTARHAFAESEAALLADAAAWIALGLGRTSAQPKLRASEFPASTRTRSA